MAGLAVDVNCRNCLLRYAIMPCGNTPCVRLAEKVRGIPPQSSKRGVSFPTLKLFIEAAGAHSPQSVYLSMFTVRFLAFMPTPPPFLCVEEPVAQLVFV